MIALRPQDHTALSVIVAAGPDGVQVGREVSISSAVALDDAGLIDLNEAAKHAVATSQGRAFHYRTAA